MSNSCDCCSEDNVGACPHHGWIPLFRWKGGRTLPNNLRDLHLEGFKLRLTFNNSTETTGLLSKSALGTEIQNALSALPNIGSGVLVTGGPLPNDIYVEFASASTTQQNIPQLEVLDEAGNVSLAFQMETVTEGTNTSNEIQKLKRRLGRWEELGLDRYLNTTWMWRVVCTGTGNVPAGTVLCLQQNRRIVKEWIAPIGYQPSLVSFKLSLGNIQWNDTPPTVHGEVVGGTFTVTLATDFWRETTPDLAWNITANDLQTALQALPNATRAGDITVTGGPLTYDTHFGVTFDAPPDRVSLTTSTNLIGTSPQISTATIEEGGIPIGPQISNEKQIVSFLWPADGGSFKLVFTGNGTTQTTTDIPFDATAAIIKAKLVSLVNIGPNDVFVSLVPVGTHTRHILIDFFPGNYAGLDVEQMTVISSLANSPTIIVQKLNPSTISEFLNEYDALNLGTTWEGHIRTAYGNVVNRTLHSLTKEYTVNSGELPGTYVVNHLPCGYGTVISQECAETFPTRRGVIGLGGYGLHTDGFSVTHLENGDLLIVSGTPFELPFEFELQVACLGCHYDASYNLWGSNERTTNLNLQWYDRQRPSLYSPTSPTTCGEGCVIWEDRDDNVPYLFRSRFGINGYDAHLVNDVFMAEGARKARKPACTPDVVLLGNGYWLETNHSRSQARYKCEEGQGKTLLCAAKPKREFVREFPVSAIDRLREIYGTDFSYWGGWLHPDSTFSDKIKCDFSNYDLTDIKVLFLGGMTIGRVPQMYSNAGIVIGQVSFCGGGTILANTEVGDQFSGGDNLGPWKRCLNMDFEEGTLQPLIEWLNLGSRVLVLDGGVFPTKFLQALGLATTVEQCRTYQPSPFDLPLPITDPETLNGSAFTKPVWGSTLPNPYSPSPIDDTVFFRELVLDPVEHPFTFGVLEAYDANGDKQSNFDLTQQMTGIAGEPVSFNGDGARGFSKGLVNLTQKFRFPRTHGLHPANDDVALVPGLREYTTNALELTPGSNTRVIGRVKGKIAISPWMIGNVHTTKDVDYPAIVVETWGNSFKLKFTHQNTSYITTTLPFTATSEQIKAALEALPNIGADLTVIGGPLPGSIDIEFSTSATSLQDVGELEVLETDSLKLESVTEGSATNNEIQRILGKANPSRVVISYINELVEPDAWGVNWDHISNPETVPPGKTVVNFLGDNEIEYLSDNIDDNCFREPIPNYCKAGYNFGLGMSYLANRQFLLNLLEKRHDY